MEWVIFGVCIFIAIAWFGSKDNSSKTNYGGEHVYGFRPRKIRKCENCGHNRFVNITQITLSRNKRIRAHCAKCGEHLVIDGPEIY